MYFPDRVLHLLEERREELRKDIHINRIKKRVFDNFIRTATLLKEKGYEEKVSSKEAKDYMNYIQLYKPIEEKIKEGEGDIDELPLNYEKLKGRYENLPPIVKEFYEAFTDLVIQTDIDFPDLESLGIDELLAITYKLSEENLLEFLRLHKELQAIDCMIEKILECKEG
jgi:hypothetical protein